MTPTSTPVDVDLDPDAPTIQPVAGQDPIADDAGDEGFDPCAPTPTATPESEATEAATAADQTIAQADPGAEQSVGDEAAGGDQAPDAVVPTATATPVEPDAGIADVGDVAPDAGIAPAPGVTPEPVPPATVDEATSTATPELVAPDTGVEPPPDSGAAGPPPTATPEIFDVDPDDPTSEPDPLATTEAAPEATQAVEETPEPISDEPTGFDLVAAETTLPLGPGGLPAGGTLHPNFAFGVDAVASFAADGTTRVVDLASGQDHDLGPGAAPPSWSGDDQLALSLYLPGEPYPVVAVWERGASAATPITGPSPDEASSDLPAGWTGGNVYYQRTFPDDPSRVELRRVRPDGTGDELVWSSVQTGGPGAFDGAVGQALIGPRNGLIAYVAGGELLIAPEDDPGAPFAASPAPVGFDWSPEGDRLVVSDGFTLSVIDAGSGNVSAAAANSAGVPIGGPLWLGAQLYFVDLGPEPAIRRLPLPV